MEVRDGATRLPETERSGLPRYGTAHQAHQSRRRNLPIPNVDPSNFAVCLFVPGGCTTPSPCVPRPAPEFLVLSATATSGFLAL